ncbi:MAG: hypothetical protein ACRDJ0_16790 [Actinomycetota bacterium]
MPVAPVCFPTFSEALAFATNGALVVGAGFTPLDLTDAMLNQAEQQQVQDLAVETTAVATVIGIEYWNQNYDTSNYTYTASVNDSGGCAGNTTWQIGYVGDFHNDKWSSAQNFQSCSRVPHFEHAQFNPNGGATRDCSPCSYIGDAMNNRTSSIRWRD